MSRVALLPAWLVLSFGCGLDTDGPDSASASGTTSDAPGQPTGDVTDGSPAVVTCVDGTASIPDGFLGVSYSFQLSASDEDAPYLWHATGLPDGLTLLPDPGDTTKAVLSGTPTETGTFDIEIVVAGPNRPSTPTQCGELQIREPPQVNYASLLADLGGCIPVGDDDHDSLADLLAQGTFSFDDSLPLSCELVAGKGNGSFDFDRDPDTPQTFPAGITFDAETCTTGGSIDSSLAYGIYAFTTTLTQSTSASTATAYIPYCAPNMTQAPSAYGIKREDTGVIATFLPGVQQLSPGDAVDYGTDVPDPKVTVDYGMPCMGGTCHYGFVYLWNTLSADAQVSANPNAKFPAMGLEGFTHGIKIGETNTALLSSFEKRAWIVNISFDYCIAENNVDCGNDESDPGKRAEKVRQNGNGSNYYFSLVLLPAT